MNRRHRSSIAAARCVAAAIVVAAVAAGARLTLAADTARPPRTFTSPEEAVKALVAAVKTGKVDELLAIFGSDADELVTTSDPATARRNAEVLTVAFAEGWRLVSQGTGRRTLVIGNEAWPFPVPLVKDADRWRFDTAAGKEEVIARRIGRNEIAAIATCRTYVSAQVRYSLDGHDGKPSGLYATAMRSDPGRHNGLYWLARHGEKRSPLGELLAEAAEDGHGAAERGETPSPFHGYHFKILTAQGDNALGGAQSYIVDGDMSRGFALVAWPSQYDATGVMTFVVNHNGVLWQKDLGPETEAAARAMTVYNPDVSWQQVK